MNTDTEEAAATVGMALDRSAVAARLKAPDRRTLRFERCSFDHQDLGGLDLSGARFVACSFEGTGFEKAVLARTLWSHCRAPFARFDMADLTEARFAGGDYNNASWSRARLSAAAFSEAKLTGASFHQAQTLGLSLRHAILVSADLRGISFRKARLEGLNFAEADLAGCDFSQAVLVGCSLRDANLKGCSFRDADLSATELGAVQVGDLGQHFKGCTLSTEQAAGIVAALGITVL